MSKKRNLDIFLAEIFKQYIAIKDNDFERSQEVFKSVFDEVKLKMGEKCNYFQKYSGQVMYAGSVYDGIKVSRLDEFDMDIVVRLPISYKDGEHGIMLENDQPGFVKMRIIHGFDNLDKQPEWEKCHKVTREWRDADKYFLQNKFRQWMHGNVQKALNEMNEKVTVNGVTYVLKFKESGPAYTLNISNMAGEDAFNLDVDLVPVIRFQLPRWPAGYKTIESTQVKDWLVVPKPNKALKNENLKNRCWRLSFQEYEREMMKGCQQLKTTIRLVKKLRDSLDMKNIASYYIKTLFLWKIQKNDKKFWQNKLSVTFRIMVEDLRDAIKEKNIPYFWHEKNNLIETLKPTVQKLYVEKLNDVLNNIASNNIDSVVGALLNAAELSEFKNSEFYQKNSRDVTDGLNVSRQSSASNVSRQMSTNSSANGSNQSSQDYDDSKADKKILFTLIEKIEILTSKVTALEDRLAKLELAKKIDEINVMDERIPNGVLNAKNIRMDNSSDSIKKTNIIPNTHGDIRNSLSHGEEALIDLS